MKKSVKKTDAAAATFNDTIEDDDDGGVEKDSKPNYFDSSMSMPIGEWKKKQKEKEKSSVDIEDFQGTSEKKIVK